MKIIHLDPDNSDERAVAFVTDADLTNSELIRVVDLLKDKLPFKIKNGLLLVEHPICNEALIPAIIACVTEAEIKIKEHLEKEKQKPKIDYERISKLTGIPIKGK